MRALVTGSAGRIGRRVVPALQTHGCEVRTFDRCAGREPDHWPGSLLDAARVRQVVQGCDAVIHLAAIPNDRPGQEDDVIATNVLGTWHVLQAAAEAGVTRVVYFSSIQALGLTGTERQPDALPLDDAHPRHPARPYALSKAMCEDTCRYFAETAGMTALCLRPTLVADEEMYAWWRSSDARSLPRRYRRYFASDMWSYCDIEDVVRAAVLALDAQDVPFGTFLLAARDTTSTVPTADLLAEHYPDVPLRLPAGTLDADPFHGLVDTAAAERVLGWRPERSWRET